jgi:hypothetical protein
MDVDIGPRTVNFHIWAEPKDPLDDDEAEHHNKILSGTLCRILHGAKLKFNSAYFKSSNQVPVKPYEESLPTDVAEGDLDRLVGVPARPPAICQSLVANNYSG